MNTWNIMGPQKNTGQRFQTFRLMRPHYHLVIYTLEHTSEISIIDIPSIGHKHI